MLKTEADVLRTLNEGTYTLRQLYDACRVGADISRADGLRAPGPDHPHDRRWRHRVRCALQALRAHGIADRVGHAKWLLKGTLERPEHMTLLVSGATLAEFELRLADAIELLRSLDEPADLVLCDPPYGLDRDAPAEAHRLAQVYGRHDGRIVPGYRDVPVDRYEKFTSEWVGAAARALRPGGQLAVVTGPQQAALVQYHAERAGLSWVSSISAFKTFALRATRQPAVSHWTITVMCRGARNHRLRSFNTPADLPKAHSGRDYPLDWWPENGRVTRSGLLRYDNQLPLRMVLRIVEAFSDRGELVVDPCLGAGTTGEACMRLQRRFIGGDVNPNALRFTAARMLDEVLWPAERQLTLLAA